MKKNFLLLCLIVFCLTLHKESKSQFNINVDGDALSEIKDKTTIVVFDKYFKESDTLKDIFKKYWTITKEIKFIDKKDLNKSITPENCFISASVIKELRGLDKPYNKLRYIFQLWSCNESFFKIRKKDPDYKYDENSDSFTKVFAKTFIINLKPAIIKNYLQIFSSFITKHEKISTYDSYVNNTKIRELRKETLYVENEEFINDYYITDEKDKIEVTQFIKKNIDTKELFQDYKYKYSIISPEEFEKRITGSDKSVFYIAYVQSSLDKYIVVIEAKSGTLTYCEHYNNATKIKSKDIESLSKKISEE